jgi:hypothetical protein
MKARKVHSGLMAKGPLRGLVLPRRAVQERKKERKCSEKNLLLTVFSSISQTWVVTTGHFALQKFFTCSRFCERSYLKKISTPRLAKSILEAKTLSFALKNGLAHQFQHRHCILNSKKKKNDWF